MLEVIAGPMFSGKSEELMRRLRRAQVAGRKTILFKPLIDTRYSDIEVVSHNGQKMTAISLSYKDAMGFYTIAKDNEVIGIDEVQFFDSEWLVEALDAYSGDKTLIVSGLDMTYRAEPFGCMPHLLAVAEKVDKLTAICHKCGNEATRTQRLLDGAPAPFSGPTVQVGGIESYEARCRECFEIA